MSTTREAAWRLRDLQIRIARVVDLRMYSHFDEPWIDGVRAGDLRPVAARLCALRGRIRNGRSGRSWTGSSSHVL